MLRHLIEISLQPSLDPSQIRYGAAIGATSIVTRFDRSAWLAGRTLMRCIAPAANKTASRPLAI